jgi:hypothetical protein
MANVLKKFFFAQFAGNGRPSRIFVTRRQLVVARGPAAAGEIQGSMLQFFLKLKRLKKKFAIWLKLQKK